MEPDNYQQAWRAQASETRVTVDADSLLKAAQGGLSLRAANVLEDCGEIATSLLLLTMWIYLGIGWSLPWTWWCLIVPVCFWPFGFTLVVRARQRRKRSELGEPLIKSVKETLALVERRINKFWRIELPVDIAVLVFFAHAAVTAFALGLFERALCYLILSAFFFPFYAFRYFLNRRVLRKEYEPQRRELRALLASLGDETTSE